MRVLSHISDGFGACSLCGVEFPPVIVNEVQLAPNYGVRVGVIDQLRCSEPMAYIIKQVAHDSNQMCSPQ